jgi:hypothetical protein
LKTILAGLVLGVFVNAGIIGMIRTFRYTGNGLPVADVVAAVVGLTVTCVVCCISVIHAQRKP